MKSRKRICLFRVMKNINIEILTIMEGIIFLGLILAIAYVVSKHNEKSDLRVIKDELNKAKTDDLRFVYDMIKNELERREVL